MKELILLIISAIAVLAVSIYVIALVLFPRDWFDTPDFGPNVGEEE